jgi:hypothetical protein
MGYNETSTEGASMFSRRPLTELERVYDAAVRELKEQTIVSEEYLKALDIVYRLHKMVQEEKPNFVSRDTLVLAGANLLGILLIIRHEHVNVITSRAMNMVIKPR